MVVASADGTMREKSRVISHPAPSSLVGEGHDITMATSNAVAAIECASGKFNACVTTAQSAAEYGLKIVTDFGLVNITEDGFGCVGTLR